MDSCYGYLAVTTVQAANFMQNLILHACKGGQPQQPSDTETMYAPQNYDEDEARDAEMVETVAPKAVTMPFVSTLLFDGPTVVVRSHVKRTSLFAQFEEDRAFTVVARGQSPSLQTLEVSSCVKIFFESLFYTLLRSPSSRAERRQILEKVLTESPTISTAARERLRWLWNEQESRHLRSSRSRVDLRAFEVLKDLGHGAFGVVKLARHTSTDKLYAIKVVNKEGILLTAQEGHLRSERDVMIQSSAACDWIVKLHYTFQDDDSLYFVMDFMPGGDFLNLLIERQYLQEDAVRFYIAEMILCIEETHKMGYIHRDIKPDNFLFSGNGHLKLSDFGLSTNLHWMHDATYFEELRTSLCQKMGIPLSTMGDTIDRKKSLQCQKAFESTNRATEWTDKILDTRENKRRTMAYSTVGTVGYMAVEVLRGQGYSFGCDWWSLGIVLYECLYGCTPFHAHSRTAIKNRIRRYKTSLSFPASPAVGRSAHDLILKLICEPSDRITARCSFTSSGFKEDLTRLKKHPFFDSIDWDRIRSQTPPFVPELTSNTDTRYFEHQSSTSLSHQQARADRMGRPKDILLRDKVYGAEALRTR